MAENDTPDEKITPAQRRAIAALLSERDVRAAAKAAGVSERSLWRWLKDRDFTNELNAAQGEAIDATIRRLAELSGQAVDTLRSAMTSKSTPIGSKIRAADIVLGRLLAMKELGDLEQRIAALELAQQMKEAQK